MICGFKSVTSFAKKWKTAVRGRQAVRKLSTFYRQGTAFAASGTGASRISEGCFGPRKSSYVRAAGMASRVRICRSVVPVAGADRRPAFQPAMSVRPHAAADGEVVRNRVCRGRKSGFGSARNPVFRFSAAEGTAIGMFQKTNMPRGIRHGACKSSVSERSNALTAMLGCRISARPFLRRP